MVTRVQLEFLRSINKVWASINNIYFDASFDYYYYLIKIKND